MSLLLTPQERDRFVIYLNQQADSNEQIAEQLEKVGGPPMLTVAKKNRMEAAAMRLVSLILASAEYQELS